MYCSQCGSLIPADSRFCTACGHPAENVQAALEALYKRPLGISTLAVLQFLGAVFWLLLGAALLAMPGVPAGPLLAAACLALAGVQTWCGYGLWTLKGYGRTIQLVYSWIGLLGFPIGTIASVLILIYLYRPGMKVLFSGKEPALCTPAEIALVANLVRGGSVALAVTAVLLLVVGTAFAGIIAAIVLPSLLNAVDRGKQKRTVADMRAIGKALDSFATEVGHYPIAPRTVSLEALEPGGIALGPAKDAWAGTFYYQSDGTGSAYMLISHGKDRRPSDGSVGPTVDFDCDIIVENGTFTAYPEGIQT